MALKQFKTESRRLLDLVINSIYTNKEIFLRELISNASDAIDKLYFLSLTDDGVKTAREDYSIRLTPDKEANTLTIEDNGVGMTAKELEENLGVIAKSGSLSFKQKAAGVLDDEATEEDEAPDRPIDIIGQFGVGFYSAFMVADKITVDSRAYGADDANRWESTGAAGYSVSPCEKEGVGTKITLYLKKDTDNFKYSDFTDPMRLESLVKKYSDYIRYPIVMEKEIVRPVAGESEKFENARELCTLNSMVPLWRRPKKEIAPEDYAQFYREKFQGYGRPARVIHTTVEGAASFTALLFIPTDAPYEYYTPEYQKGIQLYSNGVLIMEKSELLPEYFAFVRGLVDSQDISLNISREMLQQDGQLKRISTTLEKRVKGELLDLMKNDRETYEEFFSNFGAGLKMGCCTDFGLHKLAVQDLLLFHSAKLDKLVTLDEYADAMPEGQPYIYYAAGETNERLAKLPAAERVLDKGYDILFLTGNTDEFVLQMISTFRTWEFRNIGSGDLGLESAEEAAALKARDEAARPLFTVMEQALAGKVKTVRLTEKLKSHPVCITSDGPLSIEMERMLNSIPGQERVESDKALEINAGHPVFNALESAFAEGDTDKVKLYTDLLYNQALLIEGIPVDDPVAFSSAVCQLMVSAAGADKGEE